MTTTERPVSNDLFTEVDGRTRLLGSRCADCSVTTFPTAFGCPRCTGDRMKPVALAEEGTVWSWTVQRFRPKSPYRGPDEFTPYGVGYVHLGDVIVESVLLGDATAGYEIGSPVRMRIVPAWTEDDGTTVLSYAFEVVATDDLADQTQEG